MSGSIQASIEGVSLNDKVGTISHKIVDKIKNEHPDILVSDLYYHDVFTQNLKYVHHPDISDKSLFDLGFTRYSEFKFQMRYVLVKKEEAKFYKALKDSSFTIKLGLQGKESITCSEFKTLLKEEMIKQKKDETILPQFFGIYDKNEQYVGIRNQINID